MVVDYTDTGDLLALGNLLSIGEAARRMWEYCRRINASWPGSGNPFFKSVLNNVFPNTSLDPDALETAAKAFVGDDHFEDYRSVHNRWKESVLDVLLMPYLGRKMDLDEGTIGEGAIVYEYDNDLRGQTGQTTVTRRGGVLGTLARFMELAGESIRTNGVVLGALTAQAGNRGVLAEASVGAGRSHALNGIIVLHCTDDTIGRTEFSFENRLTNPLPTGEATIEGDNTPLVTGEGAAGVDYEDGPTGVTMQLRYGPFVESGDGGNIISGFAWTNPHDDDSDKGKIYMRIKRVTVADTVNGIFTVELFRGANMALAENFIGSKPIKSVSGSEVVSIPGPQSNFTFTFDRAAADTALPSVGNEDNDIVFDQKVPREGDVWTKTVTNDEAGIFSTKIAKMWRASLAVATNPSQTIPDTLAPDFAIAAV
jgi:hypothetical protein